MKYLKKSHFNFIILGLLISVCAGFDFQLYGKIEDNSGTPISGVTIRPINANTEYGDTVTFSDSEGNYRATASKDRSCGGNFYSTLAFEKDGYKTFFIEIYVGDDPRELNIILEATGSSLDSRPK